jgi:hypothetical protein
MPHTHSRYMQDLGFSDGLVSYGVPEISAVSPTGTVALSRASGAGIPSWLVSASSSVFFEINLLDAEIRRSGYTEDLQDVFGSTFGSGQGGFAAGPSGLPGSGIPASAEPQGRPGSSNLGDGYILPGTPQPASGMATLQEITPRTALKIKGLKPLSITVLYSVGTGAMTTLTIGLYQNIFKNGVAVAQTIPLAAGLNGLQNVAAANPYATVIPIPNAVFYQITPLTQLWAEINVVAPAGNTFNLFGLEMNCEFNYN